MLPAESMADGGVMIPRNWQARAEPRKEAAAGHFLNLLEARSDQEHVIGTRRYLIAQRTGPLH